MDITSLKKEYYEEDADYQDNKTEVRTTKSKVFQCTGYGNCDMVFTRSEHLARHMRKHTGEKPFQCIVPGCERMFSRYDNMMQHTQTHNKSRGTLRRIKTKTKKIRGGKKNGFASSSSRGCSSDEYSDDFGPLPSPPPSRRGSSRDLSSAMNAGVSSTVKYNPMLDDDDMIDSGDEEYRPPASYYHHQQYQHQHHQQQQHQYQYQQRPLSPPSHLPHPSYHNPHYNPHRYEGWYHPPSVVTPIATTSLPPSRCPDSPISSESSGSRSDHTSSMNELAKHRRRSTPQVYYHPYPYHSHHHSSTATTTTTTTTTTSSSSSLSSEKQQGLVPILPRRQESVLPQLACYLVSHPNALPESYFQPKMTEPKIHRRLSLQDLSNPIELLKDSSELNKQTEHVEEEEQEDTATTEEEEVGIDLTEDEFQAIQGFGQFYRAAVTCTK